MNLYELLGRRRDGVATQPNLAPCFAVEKRDTPVVGYRAWRAGVRGGQAVLASVIVRDYHWPTRRPAVAHDPNGVHGIHAFKLLEGALWTYHHNYYSEPAWTRVFGAVALAGTVVEHDKGYRASHAYPTLLYYTPDVHGLVQNLARTYGVEMAPLPAG
jgi:hypothetical protein